MRIIKFEKVYMVEFRNQMRSRIEFGIYKIVKTLKTNALHLFSFIMSNRHPEFNSGSHKKRGLIN